MSDDELDEEEREAEARAEAAKGFGPPWIIFADEGKPLAILPAGRPGEVANTEGLSMETVQRIVDCANERERGYYEKIAESLEELGELDEVKERLKAVKLVPVPLSVQSGKGLGWWPVHSDNTYRANIRCPNGHVGAIVDHEISPNGSVEPSVVCPAKGCGFHEFVQLTGWAKAISKAPLRLVE